jgi:hypothetical protein
MILTGCASSNCHGGVHGGGFILYNETSDPATYTNFYILAKYTKKIGEGKGMFSGPAERKMIERGRGEQSILAQFGLPPAKATMRHPPVKTGVLRPLFRDPEDRTYKRLTDWMNSKLKTLEPQYKIDYKPPTAPGAAPATQPSK